jgi:hypothetical protein
MQETFKEDSYIIRYMDTWTLGELQQCRSLLHKAMLSQSVTERYDKWGGSPRYVLKKLDAQQQTTFQQAIDECTVEQVQRALGGISAHADVSNRILHLRVKPDYITTYIAWASPLAAERVAYKLWTDYRAQLVVFLSASAGLGDVGGVRGNLWEGYCHARLAAGGWFRCRALTHIDDCSELVIPSSSSRHIFDEWKALHKFPDGTYCRPRSKGNAAIDAALLPAMLFQMTSSHQHGINCAGLKTAFEALTPQAPGHQVAYYFIVPPDRFGNFTSAGVDQGTGVAQLRQAVRLYVLEMPFDGLTSSTQEIAVSQ